MKKLLLALAVTTSLSTFGSFSVSYAAGPRNSTSATTAKGDNALSEGRKQYQFYFQTYYDKFRLLADAGQAQQFKEVWEHKFDAGNQLDSEGGAQAAVEEIARSGSLLGCPEAFDGACLYRRAFQAYMQYHYHPEDGTPRLIDPVQRAKFAAQWEHKFDGKPDLLTEAGTDSAIRKMRDSLGQRFDYFNSVTQTKAEHERVRANFGGIGVPITFSNDETMKLADPLELLAHEPPADSPAYGLVHFGDVIVMLGGKPVSEMTYEEAVKTFGGPVGSHQTVTVHRKNKDGETVSVDVDIVRGYVADPLSSEVPSGDGTVGIPVQLANTDKLKLGGEFGMMAGEPFEESPAIGKLHAGDVLLAANGVSFEGLTLNEAVEKVRGPAGTKVVLTVRPKGEVATRDVVVPRRVIQQHAVHFKALADDIGFIRVDQFMASNVPADYANAVARTVLPLVAQKLATMPDALSQAKAAEFNALKQVLDHNGQLDEETMPIAVEATKLYDELGIIDGGVIIDLRSDPGGDLGVFHTLASMSLLKGTIYAMPSRDPGTDSITIHEEVLMPEFEMVSNHPVGGGPQQNEITTSKRRPLLVPATMPMMVLVNGKSASASELFSGMMQANHRALIIGESTLGKGVGQMVVDLPYGRSLHVTTFEFLPGGMTSDWTGVIVDVPVSSGNGKSDAVVDAGLSQINQANARASARAIAAAASLKLHQRYFGNDMAVHAAEDNKPLAEQDKTMMR